MSLKIYNSLSRKKEEFKSIEEKKVKMYACGITVSGSAHIGHAYQAIVFDVIRRYLESLGYDVTYVRNYTDVDDKIILRARELGISPIIYANNMMEKIDSELKELGVGRPTIQVKATDSIKDMISFIERLVDKGYAYSTENGDVFFKVSSFREYGKLSNRNIKEQLIGVRKSVEPGKLDNRDFALWKNAKDDEIYWNSPWGIGRPGWHIECSVMSMKYLGETIDIHGGGRDLIFPHHENEIAQSEVLTNKQMSNYWVHNGLIKINGEKMSKSLNNGILLEDLLKKYNSEVIRFTLMINHYRSDLNIIDGLFEQSEKKIYSIYKLFDKVDSYGVISDYSSDEYVRVLNDFRNAMDNDFNTSLAISNVFDYIKDINKYIKDGNIQSAVNIKEAIVNIYEVINLFQQDSSILLKEIINKKLKENNINDSEVNKLYNDMKNYRLEKDYINADRIRQLLLDKNIIIVGDSWDINF